MALCGVHIIAELTEPFGINTGRYAPVKIDYVASPVV